MRPTISHYYRSAIESAKKEVESTPDDRVLGMDGEEWVEYLTQKHGMFEISLDDSRPEEMSEVDREYRLRGHDFLTDRPPGTLVRETMVQIELPVQPSDTLQVIWQLKLSPNTFSLSHGYPPFDYDHERGLFTDVVQPQPAAVKRGFDEIRKTVRAYNESITSENQGFRPRITQLVTTKLDRVREKHKSLDGLAAEVGIPLK